VRPVGPEASYRFLGHLAEDADGRLYDRRSREQLRRSPLRDDEGALAGGETLHAVVAVARMVRYLGERWAQRFGLSFVRLQLLLLVGDHPDEPLALSQLADALDLSPRTVTSLVDLLERDRLVTRVPHTTDRRSTLVRLTGAGRTKVDAVWKELFAGHTPGFEGFSLEEMEQLRHLAYRLLINLSHGAD